MVSLLFKQFFSLSVATAIATTVNAQITISGTVYHDIDGITGGINTNPVGGALIPDGLYAVLVTNSNPEVVLQSSAVIPSATGAYSISYPAQAPSVNARVLLLSEPQVAGTIRNKGGLIMGWQDVVVSQTVTLSSSNISGIDFAIQQRPFTTANITLAAQPNPGGTINYTVPATAFSGTDPDNSPITYVQILSVINARSITVNGITYADGINDTTGTGIPMALATAASSNGNIILPVTVDPIDGNVTVIINYKVAEDSQMDATSINSGTIKIPFTVASNFSNPPATCGSGTVLSTYTTPVVSVPMQPFNIATTVNLPQFNASLGTLVAATLNFTIRDSLRGHVENTAASDALIYSQTVVNFSASFASSINVLPNQLAFIKNDYYLRYSDDIAGSGPDYTDFTTQVIDTSSSYDFANLTGLTGLGTVPVDVNMNANTLAYATGGNVNLQYQTYGAGSFTITYYYCKNLSLACTGNGVMLDDFNTGTIQTNLTGTTANTTTDGPGIIGLERDIDITLSSATANGNGYAVEAVPDALVSVYTAGSVYLNNFTLTYDGNDNNATAVDATTGLGAVNMMGTGNFATSYLIDAIGDGRQITFTFRVYSSATNYSDGVFIVNGPYSGASGIFENLSIARTSFVTGAGAAAPANFSAVTAVQFIVSTNQNGIDLMFKNGILVPCASFGTLPVQDLQLAVQKQASSVILNWKTSAESNTKEFIIEKSSDGINFSKLGTVTAAGYSNTPKAYSGTDNDITRHQILYYRIKSVDANGSIVYSNITKVFMSSSFNVQVYPNPATAYINVAVNGTSSAAVIKIFNSQGKLILNKTALRGVNVITAKGMAKGVYLLSIADGSQVLTSQKILVQ